MSPIRPSHSPKVNGEKISFRAQHKHSIGHLYLVEISLVALEYQNKLYTAFFVRDISMLLEAEESMGLGEESFRMITDTSPLALIISRVTDGQIQYANRQALVMFKQNILELTGVSILDLFKRYTSDQSVISV